jgi:hypothetical protein
MATPLYLHARYSRDFRVARHFWMIVPIDFLLPVLWLIGQWQRRVTWRGDDFVVRKGRMVPAKVSGE